MASWVYWTTNPVPVPNNELITKPFWVPSPQEPSVVEMRNYRYQGYLTWFTASDPHECPIINDGAGGSYFALDQGPAYHVFPSKEAAPKDATNLVLLRRFRSLPFPPTSSNCLHNWSKNPNFGVGDSLKWVMEKEIGFVYDKEGPNRLQVYVFGHKGHHQNFQDAGAL